MSEDIEFSFITQVGKNVKKVYDNDPDQKEWFDEVINEYDETGEYHEGLLEEIISYLYSFDNDEYGKIAEDVIKIRNIDGDENILISIFQDSDDSATETKPDQSSTPDTFDSSLNCATQNDDDIDDDDDEDDIDESNPSQYFKQKVQDVSKFLNISEDISYLLLKNYNFNVQRIHDEWFSKKDEILSSLKIPSETSPLTIKNLGAGECPICCEEENDLYEFYCGHIMCENCLHIQITEKVKLRKIMICPCNCTAEILPHDVYKMLEKSGKNELIEIYRKTVIDSQIIADKDTKPCLCCDSLITPLHTFSLLTGCCKNCHFLTCMKCNQGFHGPLSCSNLVDFFDERQNEMRHLEEDQESWYERERRLLNNKSDHREPVLKYFKQRMAEAAIKVQKEDVEERNNINENQDDLNKKYCELNTLLVEERTLKNDPSRLIDVQGQIEKIRSEIKRLEFITKALKSKYEKNRMERKNDLNDITTEKELLINVVEDPSYFDFFMAEYQRHVDSKTYSNLNIQITNEDFIGLSYKKCQKCGRVIEKINGCNYINCLCGFEFCFYCNEPWHPNHSDHFSCPKYNKDRKGKGKSLSGIDFNDMSDKKFYPPPMNTETKKYFTRYILLKKQFNEANKKLQELEDKLRATTNEDESKSISELPYDKLTPKNKIIKCIMKNYSEKESKVLADKIINTIVFGQKTLMYGFPQVFYITLKNGNVPMFEFHLNKIEEYIKSILKMINDPSNLTHSDFAKLANLIEYEVKIVLNDSESI